MAPTPRNDAITDANGIRLMLIASGVTDHLAEKVSFGISCLPREPLGIKAIEAEVERLLNRYLDGMGPMSSMMRVMTFNLPNGTKVYDAIAAWCGKTGA